MARAGTPPQNGPQIGLLPGAGKAGGPPSTSSPGKAFGGAPTIFVVATGERTIDRTNDGPVVPAVYGGGAQVVKPSRPPSARGVSGSGAAGAK